MSALVSIPAKCCGTTFTARTEARAVEMHVEYHNDQYSRGRRDSLISVPVPVTIETEVAVADVWIGDEIRLAPAIGSRPAQFSKVTSVELVNAYTSVAYVKIRTEDGDELLLAPQRVRTVRLTFLTSAA